MTIHQLSKILRTTRDPILRASLQHRLHVALRQAAKVDRDRLFEATMSAAAGISKPWLATGA